MTSAPSSKEALMDSIKDMAKESQLSPHIGEASAITLLLSDWDKFGLSERVCYHFDLIQTLTASSTTKEPAIVKKESLPKPVSESKNSHEAGVCGVVRLLECVPKSKYNRRALQVAMQAFDHRVQQVHSRATVSCHEPLQLPLRLSTSTRVSFAYEVTKVAFCLDASPTLVSTFGNGVGSDDDVCCALDRLSPMVSTFFKALVQRVTPALAASQWDPKGWQPVWHPVLAVTVIAVYPRGTGASDTSLLVRDYRVHDIESAETLSKNIAQWALNDVETEIAHRLSHGGTAFGSPMPGYDAWTIPTHSTSLRDILDAGDAALSLLPSDARPCIVLATDCRSVACESILDLFSDADRVDIPLVVLDLSSPSSHIPIPLDTHMSDEPTFLTYDPSGPSSFPLHLSDDSESLFGICKATGGCFFDTELLREAAHTVTGPMPTTSSFKDDPYFSVRRRAFRPNAVQWYMLFAVSPLSPASNSAHGRLPPPNYLRRKLGIAREKHVGGSLDRTESMTSVSSRWNNASNETVLQRTFLTLTVPSVRIKGLLMLRVREGYRTKQYGLNSKDPDKVSIQFTLPLELGTVVHYELSFTSSSGANPMVGGAHIKVELSGEKGFIQTVKNDFITNSTHNQTGRLSTIAMSLSKRLHNVLKTIRQEDSLQSLLCEVALADKHSKPDSSLAKELGKLTRHQRQQHFRLDKFDVVCLGRMSYQYDDNSCHSDLVDFDNGEEALYAALSEWSTQTIDDTRRYVREIPTSRDGIGSFYVIEIRQSRFAARLFTVTVETLGGSNALDRLEILSSLKDTLSLLNNVSVLSKQMDDYLVGLRNPNSSNVKPAGKQRFMESHFHHESWDGVIDPELLPLLTKRRMEVGKFWLLHSSDSYSLFAKLLTIEGGMLVTADVSTLNHASSSDLYQAQYQIEVCPDKVTIDMHVEREQGIFFTQCEQTRLIHDIFTRVRNRDQECGRALRSRTALLEAETSKEEQLQHVGRLLKYASRVSRRLRFFHSGAAIANTKLEELSIDLLVSGSFAVKVSKLDLDGTVIDDNVDAGIWFLVEFDRHNTSIAHLSMNERQLAATTDRPSFMYRELTFFTIGISDLYCKRENGGDVVGDEDLDSTDDRTSEYLGVTEFADRVEDAHGKNYARAAYLALRHDSTASTLSFDSSDFEYALKSCDFVPIVHELISGGKKTEVDNEESKLSIVIRNILRPVPGDDRYLFFCGDEQELGAPSQKEADLDNIDDGHFSEFDDEDEDEGNDEEGQNSSLSDEQTFDTSDQILLLSSEALDRTKLKTLVNPPVFVSFALDNRTITYHEISRMTRSAHLTARISVFDRGEHFSRDIKALVDPSELPSPHNAVGAELLSLLTSYEAEQSLERFRHFGTSITDDDLNGVKRCLRKSRGVLASFVNLHFYIAKTDSMIPASAPAGVEAEVEKGVSLLRKELQGSGIVVLKPTSSGGFFVIATDEGSSRLSFWCFVTIVKLLGRVTIEVYHPEGRQLSSHVLSEVQEHVIQACHRVNQLLLLRSLHRNRAASDLLITGDTVKEETPLDKHDIDESPREASPLVSFPKGFFACPVKFRTLFTLYHRCSASQVIHSLEATALHSLAVSNRRGIFVYKDESGAISYMKLIGNTLGGDGEDNVELLVFGVHEPGPSVTRQLNRLLQKRLMSLAVDALSSVLTKNPHFNWKQADVQFLRSFEGAWRSLEDDHGKETEMVREYLVPTHVFDPIMMLLYFRQNLCGSTFFHRLHGAWGEGESSSPDEGRSISTKAQDHPSGETHVHFDVREFTFFYNNSPSPLDPDFQPVCTLTETGAKYSSQTGTGIAIIEVSLIKHDGAPADELRVGEVPTDTESFLAVENDILRLHEGREESTNRSQDSMKHRIRVRIINTALDREVLHAWILLTLNQVLIAWSIERHIQRTQLGLLGKPKRGIKPDPGTTRLLSNVYPHLAIDNMCPGLPYLMSMLESAHSLPHPAVERFELGGVIKASSVATVALNLLEKCIFSLIRKERRPPPTSASLKGDFDDLFAMRLSRTHRPAIVNLCWDPRHEAAIVVDTSLELRPEVTDSPIDCPEYLFFFSVSRYTEENQSNTSFTPPPMFFREVMVDDGIGEKRGMAFTETMLSLRNRNPTAFRRSFCFVFSVKRNRRLLLTYNWNPQLFKSIKNRLREMNFSYLSSSEQSTQSQQQRCLQILSPPTATNFKVQRSSERPDRSGSTQTGEKPSAAFQEAHTSAVNEDEAHLPSKAPARKIQRPTVIRQPKLVGKSVEGAAIQALAASRARASSSRFSAVGSAHAQKPPRDRASTSRTIPSRDRVSTEKDAGVSKPSHSKANREEAHIISHVASVGGNTSMSPLLSEYVSKKSTIPSSFYVQMKAMRFLMYKWRFVKPDRSICPLMREFLLSRSMPFWSDACELLSLPRTVVADFSNYFAQWIKLTTPGVFILQDWRTLAHEVTSTRQGSEFPVVVVDLKKLSRLNLGIALTIRTKQRSRLSKRLVLCEAWMMPIPPEDGVEPSDSDRVGKARRRKNTRVLERDAASIDKKSSDFHGGMLLEDLIFNFAGFIIERSINSAELSYRPSEMLVLLKSMVNRYPLGNQYKMRGLQYNAFTVTIVLSSYKNKYIDMFDAKSLFDCLVSDAPSFELISCGRDGLCFKEQISELETNSYCFITRQHDVTTKLHLVMLCRTNGRRLSDFVFREGSPFAVTLHDKIAVAAATIAQEILEAAAIIIRRNLLWEMLSTKPDSELALSRTELNELMRAATPIGESDQRLHLLIFDPRREMRLNWGLCCSSMQNHHIFFPHQVFENNGTTSHLFYLKAYDVFMILHLNMDGQILDAAVLAKDDSEASCDGKAMATQVFANFLLHFMWQNL